MITIPSQSIINEDKPKIRKIAKVLFLGDGAVGKSSLVTLISVSHIEKEILCTKTPKVTVGFDIQTKCFLYNGQKYEITIWDFGGQPQFRFYQQDFMKFGIVGILVFDVTRTASLTHLKEWKKIADENSKLIRYIVVGNKIDSPKRSIPSSMGKEFAASINSSYVETSAKTLDGITSLIEEIQNIIISIDEEFTNKIGVDNN